MSEEQEVEELEDIDDADEMDDVDGGDEVDDGGGDPQQHDRGLVDVARQFGLSDDEIGAFPTEQSLRSALMAMDRTTMSVLRGLQQPQANQTEAQAERQQQQVQKLIEKYELDLDPSEWDADTIEKLGGLSEYAYTGLTKLEDELKKRDDQISALTYQMQLQAAARAEEVIDEWFQKLPDEYADLFGKGELDGLPEKSQEAEERRKLVREAMAIEQVDIQLGRRPGSYKTNLQRALLARHPDKTEKVVRGKVRNEQAARQRQAISRPGSKPKTAKNPKQAAVEYVRNTYKKLGLSADSDDDDDVF